MARPREIWNALWPANHLPQLTKWSLIKNSIEHVLGIYFGPHFIWNANPVGSQSGISSSWKSTQNIPANSRRAQLAELMPFCRLSKGEVVNYAPLPSSFYCGHIWTERLIWNRQSLSFPEPKSSWGVDLWWGEQRKFEQTASPMGAGKALMKVCWSF